MDDLETLKVIKEKEESLNSKIEEIKTEKEKELSQIESGIETLLREREEALTLQMQREIEEARQAAMARSQEMIKDAVAKAARLKIRISDEEIENYVIESIEEYLGA